MNVSQALISSASKAKSKSKSRPRVDGCQETSGPWYWSDGAWVLAWFGLAMVARLAFLARAEGLLDHDQATVGLMAMDIAKGLRWPIFFDGQRYMGALEPYTAALFVRLLGHSPAVVALAPAFYFALFVAGQYWLWRRWADRPTGHLAALLTVSCAPLLAIWSVIPRGGYTVILFWALPTLWVYRQLTRPEADEPSRPAQLGWGFLLAIGHYLNPLSMIVYATMVFDWVLGRHGADLRRCRGLEGRWLDSPRAGWGWLGLALAGVLALVVACHVSVDHETLQTDFVFLMGLIPGPIGVFLGALGFAAIVAWGVWWVDLGPRAYRLLRRSPWFSLGVLLAMVPYLLYVLRTLLGWQPYGYSVLMWLRSPWSIGPHLVQSLPALGGLFGCDAQGAMLSHRSLFIELSMPTPTLLARILAMLAPLVLMIVLALIAVVVRDDRRAWRDFWALKGRAPSRPTMLALMGLAITAGFYTIQCSGTGLTAARYLVPTWIFLPGLIASGIRRLPNGWRISAAALLVVPWLAAQGAIWSTTDSTMALRPLAEELDRRGASLVLAPTAVGLHVANLTSGRVGVVEYHSFWPRISDRYLNRHNPGEPILCLVDRGANWPLLEDLGQHLEELENLHPGKIRLSWEEGRYEIWEANLPLQVVLNLEGADRLLSERNSGKVTGRSNPTH